MPTFYDPVELEDIDIDDIRASFYLLAMPKDAGYKLCGTVLNLSSQMKFDPETKIPKYWLVSREQVKKADASVLFPEGKLRASPFKTLKELNTTFQFNPSFDPKKGDNVIREKYFGWTHISNAESARETMFRREFDAIRIGGEERYTYAETIGGGSAPDGLFNQHHVNEERSHMYQGLSGIGLCKIVAICLFLAGADHVIEGFDLPHERHGNINAAIMISIVFALASGLLGQFMIEVPCDVASEIRRNRG